jgi:hypothetical protein
VVVPAKGGLPVVLSEQGKNNSRQFKAFAEFPNESKEVTDLVKWSSEPPSGAIFVNKQGRADAVKAGKAFVVATLRGVSGRAEVTVKSAGAAGTMRKVTGGIWTSSPLPAPVTVQGGQTMRITVTNTHVFMPATLKISSNLGGAHGAVILPSKPHDFIFQNGGKVPMSWTFDPSIETDDAVLAWQLFSDWLPGDPVDN